ncbi:MAG: hypothetical protein NVS2B7_39300 [Herpetosiphon sp.]
MLDHTIAPAPVDQFVAAMTEGLTALVRNLSTWTTTEQRTLGQLEQQVMRSCKELGTTLLAGLTQLLVPPTPPPTARCSCGHPAPYHRMRPATIKTILGPIRLTRPYYHCTRCHKGVVPLDQQLDCCAGGISAGLDELLALLGATQESFAAAAAVLERLTLVSVCANSVRASTEQLGAVLLGAEQACQAEAVTTCTPPPVRQPPAARMYVSMDGVLVHLHTEGWKEVKLGTIYTTTQGCTRRRPDHEVVRAVDQSFVVDLAEAAAFGSRLWLEAAQRGVLAADEVVVIGDGAHWIWSLADDYFPGAVQIVDWYHATQYIWKAAHTLYGEGTDQANQWAARQRDQLWAGQVRAVISTLAAQVAAGMAVHDALTYFTNHQHRMDYAVYRARGLQIGSGTMESSCKQVIGARLKQAGMIWNRQGAEAVATVRTWLKSGRWEEGMRLRPARQRPYQRCPREQAASSRVVQARAAADAPSPVHTAAVSGATPANDAAAAILQVRAEWAQRRASHPWKRPWSRRQQGRSQDRQPSPLPVSSAA